MFDDVYKLIEHVKAGQIGDALISQGNLAIKIGEFYNAIIRGEKLAIDDGELDSAISELESCCDELKKAPKGAADPKEMDPMTILAFIKMGLEALKMFREWRKKRQEG